MEGGGGGVWALAVSEGRGRGIFLRGGKDGRMDGGDPGDEEGFGTG